MYKIGVIGDKESVLGFMAVGFSVHIADTVEEAAKLLHKLAAAEYAVLYIVEDLAKDLQEEINRYKTVPIPAIIPIPGRKGSQGFGRMNVKKSVERAVGADILFKES